MWSLEDTARQVAFSVGVLVLNISPETFVGQPCGYVGEKKALKLLAQGLKEKP